MASQNNIYLVVMDEPYKRYTKAVPSQVGGIRLDANGKEPVYFILHSHPKGFEYDAEVLEIYTEREDRYFRQANRGLFAQGLLKEYFGEQPELDDSNVLTDAEVQEVAAMRNIESMRKRLNELSSVYTIRRILAAANEIGRPQKTVQMIESRIKELES